MRVLTIAAVLIFATLAACSEDAPVRTVAGGDPAIGKRLIEQYQCGSCHAVPGVAAADSSTGPPLNGLGKRSYIAGRIPNVDKALVAWLVNPPALKPGTMMPDLGVSEGEARHMAAYLYSVE